MHLVQTSARQRMQQGQTSLGRVVFCFIGAPWLHPAMPQIGAADIYRLAYEAALQSQDAQRRFRRAAGAGLN